MDPITIALALASQFAPALIKHLTGSDKAADVATQVVGIAQQVTGKAPDQVVEALKADPTLLLQFQTHTADLQSELDRAYFTDLASARDRDVKLAQAGAKNYRADVMFALACVLIFALVYIVWKDHSIPEYAKGIFTLVLGRFLGYLDQIYQFEFGSTRSSRTKDTTIANLSQGQDGGVL